MGSTGTEECIETVYESKCKRKVCTFDGTCCLIGVRGELGNRISPPSFHYGVVMSDVKCCGNCMFWSKNVGYEDGPPNYCTWPESADIPVWVKIEANEDYPNKEFTEYEDGKECPAWTN